MFPLLKSVLHNLGVVLVGFVFAFANRRIDKLLRVAPFHSVAMVTVAWLFVAIGFCIRVWATVYFYRQGMKVISLEPQTRLITTGPFRFSRNPLYLGGNFFIFLGAVLALGSPSGLVTTALVLIATDMMIRREERQLRRIFGDQWIAYTQHVRRWI